MRTDWLCKEHVSSLYELNPIIRLYKEIESVLCFQAHILHVNLKCIVQLTGSLYQDFRLIVMFAGFCNVIFQEHFRL